MTILHKPRVVVPSLIAIYILSFIGLSFAELPVAAKSFCFAYIISEPYLLPLSFLGSSEHFKRYVDPVWVRFLLVIIGIGYVAKANSWASDLLNSTFGVSASHFPISEAILTYGYLPVNFLAPIVLAILVVVVFFASFIFIIILLD
ncbi:hypothetical protein ACS8YF_18840 [Salinisphaera sp. SWV1]|uniref:hypothetical protein n=1 Tax=Salinisphaera sp. SWV1 TaxID=3454139 RepID=UPI003F87B6BA